MIPHDDRPIRPMKGHAIGVIDVRLVHARRALDTVTVETRMSRIVCEAVYTVQNRALLLRGLFRKPSLERWLQDDVWQFRYACSPATAGSSSDRSQAIASCELVNRRPLPAVSDAIVSRSAACQR